MYRAEFGGMDDIPARRRHVLGRDLPLDRFSERLEAGMARADWREVPVKLVQRGVLLYSSHGL